MAPTLAFATGPCDLGRVLVASRGRGLCALGLGDADGALIAGLTRRFRGWTPAPDPVGLADLLAAAIDRIADPTRPWDRELDVAVGTGFQRRVWQALGDIPPGKTVSYGALAAGLDPPSGPRAVGGAVGANPLAVVIPCHRVLAHDGGIGGYGPGPARKRALLAREGVAV